MVLDGSTMSLGCGYLVNSLILCGSKVMWLNTMAAEQVFFVGVFLGGGNFQKLSNV
jgi:hypothetical protein